MYRRGAANGRAPQYVKKPVRNKVRPSLGGGARGGSRPPRMGSNAPEVLLCKASGKQSADFCAAQRRKSNGILQAVKKVHRLF